MVEKRKVSLSHVSKISAREKREDGKGLLN
jgi:hypothetical protein